MDFKENIKIFGIKYDAVAFLKTARDDALNVSIVVGGE